MGDPVNGAAYGGLVPKGRIAKKAAGKTLAGTNGGTAKANGSDLVKPTPLIEPSMPGSSGQLEWVIANHVRNRRQAIGLTVAQLAELTGISKGMLSKIENAQTSPSLATIERLAAALDMPVTSLFRGSGRRARRGIRQSRHRSRDRSPGDPCRTYLRVARQHAGSVQAGRAAPGVAQRPQ